MAAPVRLGQTVLKCQTRFHTKDRAYQLLTLQGVASHRNIHTTSTVCIHVSPLPPQKASTKEGYGSTQKAEKISQAMKAYLERAKAHDKFIQEETAVYEIGRRHLANIMGADPDNFMQEDIDKAIEYLLPSGLFSKQARPKFKPPSEVFPPRKAAQFAPDGRPHNTHFYTGKPNFYNVMHEAALKLKALNIHEDEMIRQDKIPDPEKEIMLGASLWIEKMPLQDKFQEPLRDEEYKGFVKLFDRLAKHNYAYMEEKFIARFRKGMVSKTRHSDVKEPKKDESGRLYQDAMGHRKTAQAWVRVWDKGTGAVNINGQDLLDYFPVIAHREQILSPLQITGKLGEVDFEAKIKSQSMNPPPEHVAKSSHAGALRLALSRALQSLTGRQMSEKMRLAGLLTQDPRRRERKKYGQEGARKKFTWKKR